MSKVIIVIPARFGSTRLPGKPLLDIGGKPMIQHVYEKACLVKGVDKVLVATDDQRIIDTVQHFGGTAVITSTDHPSGTDRLAEVARQHPADVYINIQGDEPLVRPEDLQALVDMMCSHPEVDVGSLYHPVSADESRNPNTVKVVLNNNGNALYFSRSPIPYPREADAALYNKHIGVYAYRSAVLSQYAQLPQPMLEAAESLEQLRLLASGYTIRMVGVAPTAPGVDTPECLEKVRAIVAGRSWQAVNPLASIRLVITDVDGVLTDGSIIYDASGECQKQFHVRDGLGIRMLEESGIRVAVLSGRDSATLRKRVEDLGISFSLFGVNDKAAACLQLMSEAGVGAAETACIGDDTIDLPAFEVCAVAVAVADAPDYIKKHARLSLNKPGGQGAFREFSDMLLAAQGKSSIYESAAGFLQAMHKVAQ
ncbi:3-deoxy-manno-octulosonate cytidylyltransferase [Chitinilyticum piscinae]|uniref:3-deoxy-manno-octulosonate cytidylyltransferase n=1 Tax=Chitinilyticum piscinae TaxID=2866724 RepID=A0A8J7FKM4_9NEIS|nr:3-deoxy-manno-octulosonate cytidylyltransferase [Chitinilyticum piscinae]MBE9607846.1 3-deoxy-manno-octulosonate cytidylyltransferase [Chitinilyticum piscinae]